MHVRSAASTVLTAQPRTQESEGYEMIWLVEGEAIGFDTSTGALSLPRALFTTRCSLT